MMRDGDAWLVSLPMRVWRVTHAASCVAAAVTRVNVPSAIYLLGFVVQASLMPVGNLCLDQGGRVEMSRMEVLHAWFTQR